MNNVRNIIFILLYKKLNLFVSTKFVIRRQKITFIHKRNKLLPLVPVNFLQCNSNKQIEFAIKHRVMVLRRCHIVVAATPRWLSAEGPPLRVLDYQIKWRGQRNFMTYAVLSGRFESVV